jgi:hypothetical protein
MSAENEINDIMHPNLKGLTGLAECWINFAEAAEKAGKKGYRVKVARFVNELERIEIVAYENDLKLPEELKIKITDMIISHPDRDDIITDDINEYRGEQSLKRKSK